jgi:type 1 glutamine amidotransferase
MRVIALLLAFVAVQCWAAEKPKIVFIAGEYEYKSKETLPPFASELGREFAVETVMLQRPNDEKVQSIPGLEALREADLAVLFVRRMTLPERELAEIRKYLDAGKPLVALRTSSHAFENWKEFDKEVLGGNYQGHHGNKLKTTVKVIDDAQRDPLLNGVSGFLSEGSLYQTTPLRQKARILLTGTVEGHPPEPVAWTHEYKGGRIFYTSLGHPNDFKQESFKRLLRNGIEWALREPLKKTEAK